MPFKFPYLPFGKFYNPFESKEVYFEKAEDRKISSNHTNGLIKIILILETIKPNCPLDMWAYVFFKIIEAKLV